MQLNGGVGTGVGRLTDAVATWEASRDTALRFGHPVGVLWPEMVLLMHRIVQVDLSETLAGVEAMWPKVSEDSQIHHGLVIARAWALTARGEVGQALADLEPALAQARRIGDAQALAPTLSTKAFALFVAGRDEEANATADELLSGAAMMTPGNPVADLVLALSERGRGADWLAACKDTHRESEWVKAGTAAATGDFVRAADIYGAIGARFFEAWAQLIAAERGDLSQLEPARAFFAAQDATPFLRRCEAVLPLSA